MPVPTAHNWMADAVLQYLATGSIAPGTMGPDMAANSAWPAINAHGIKAASLDATGQPKYALLGALNVKNGTVGLEIDLVCNQLAGTTGLSAGHALSVYAGLLTG